jgi:hypothetical protein
MFVCLGGQHNLIYRGITESHIRWQLCGIMADLFKHRASSNAYATDIRIRILNFRKASSYTKEAIQFSMGYFSYSKTCLI